MPEIEKSCPDAASDRIQFKVDSFQKPFVEAGIRPGAKESLLIGCSDLIPDQNSIDWTGVENCQTLSDGGRHDLSGAGAFPSQ